MSARRLLVAALLVGACSGSDDESATNVATTVAPTTVAPTTVAPATVVTAPATTVAPTTVVTVPPTTVASTTVPPTTEPSIRFDDWCGLAVAVEDASTLRDDVDVTDPAALEDYVEEVDELLDQAVPLAPPEIAEEVALSVRSARRIYETLRDNGFDILTIDLAELGEVEDGADEASEAIETYNEANCGIPRDDQGDDQIDEAAGPGDGSLRDLFVDRLVAAGFDEAEADCLFGELDFGDPDEVTDDAVEAAFESCEIDPLRVDELSAVLGD